MPCWKRVPIAILFLAAVCSAQQDPVLRVPSMPPWKILHKVSLAYPRTALEHHIQGMVSFVVWIGKDGRIESLRLLDGHPLLVQAAREAVLQWEFKPTLVDGKPSRVLTQVQVSFALGADGKPLDEDPDRDYL